MDGKRRREQGHTASSLADHLRSLHISVKVVVVDLDYTLWKGNCIDYQGATLFSETEAAHPSGKRLALYPEVPVVLKALRSCGVAVAVASNAPSRATAEQLLRLFGLADLIDHSEIFYGEKGCKHAHFQRLRKTLTCSFRNMLFFDDMPRNVRDVEKLGCCTHLVKRGLAVAELLAGLREYQMRQSAATGLRLFLDNPKRAKHVAEHHSSVPNGPDIQAEQQLQLQANAFSSHTTITTTDPAATTYSCSAKS
mmetsp:Transcript_43931/g.95985  ORF Transcript_43931/g.95985 Transcript_43931/m.95985 type:complete len:252 (-) Transcript_43931:25-780(-)